MNVIFIQSGTLVTKEMINALKQRNDIKLIIINLKMFPPPEMAEEIFDQIKMYTPGIVITINEAGYDIEGKLHELIVKSGSYQINWHHDYPFYYHEFRGLPLLKSPQRIDFVSDFIYLKGLKEKGFNAHFLPLATDLSYFNTNGKCSYERDIAFVGNSSFAFLDNVLHQSLSKELEQRGELFLKMKHAYYRNPQFNIRQHLLTLDKTNLEDLAVTREQFIFGLEWMIGYLYRRDFVVQLAKVYQDLFTIFGDPYWSNFIKESQVSTLACYYDNLCKYYRSTKINLNINRIQIPTSFTQRHFDCKASGAFLITDKRELNKVFFVTEGPEQEIVEYHSLSHCIELISYYLKHPDERQQIANAGIEKIRKNHTYNNRVTEMFYVCKQEWGI